MGAKGNSFRKETEEAGGYIYNNIGVTSSHSSVRGGRLIAAVVAHTR